MLDAGHMSAPAGVGHACLDRHCPRCEGDNEMADHMADSVLYEVSDGLATITINRPDAMNAMNTAAKVALRDALRSAAADTAVRAVLLTATGRAFCVGQDLKEHVAKLESTRESGSGNALSTVREHYNPIVRAITEMPKPVVAGVNGVAAGAGFGFALACDYRVVADTASFNTSFMRRGPHRRLGRLLDAAPPDRAEPRRRSAVLPALDLRTGRP